MSVAVIPMAKELGWSATDRGLVSSAFFWGCAWLSPLTGHAAPGFWTAHHTELRPGIRLLD